MGDFFCKTGVNAEKDIKNPGPGTKTERKYEEVQAQELKPKENVRKIQA